MSIVELHGRSNGGDITLTELGRVLGAEVKGEGSYEIAGPRDIERLSPEQALEDHRVYFIESKAVLKRHPLAARNGAILTTAELAGEFPRALIASGDARLALIKLLSLFDPKPKHTPGVAAGAYVESSAVIHPTASVLPGAIVREGATIGARAA